MSSEKLKYLKIEPNWFKLLFWSKIVMMDIKN